jgi:hypothetical protein
MHVVMIVYDPLYDNSYKNRANLVLEVANRFITAMCTSYFEQNLSWK